MSLTVLSVFNCSFLIMSHYCCGTVALNGPYYYFLRAIDGPHVSLKQHKNHKSYDSADSLIVGKYNIDYQYVLLCILCAQDKTEHIYHASSSSSG